MKKFKKYIAVIVSVICAAGFPGHASALTLVFQGSAPEQAGKHVTVGVYDKDPAAPDFTLENVKHIDQSDIAADGAFRVRIPIKEEWAGLPVRSNLKGFQAAEAQPLYCSDAGNKNGDGTRENPYIFQTALEKALDGDTIMLLDEVKLTEDFVWPVSGKTIYIEGFQGAGKINLQMLTNLDVGCNVTFDNLEFVVRDGTQKGEENHNFIFAQGNHLIMGRGVTTSHFVRELHGGARGRNVDGDCNIEVYGGDYKLIYGGCLKGNVNGDVSVTVGGTVNKNTQLSYGNSDGLFQELNGTGSSVLAGGRSCEVKGTASVTIKDDAIVQYVRGGGEGETNLKVGKCRIRIEGGTIMNVFAAVGRSSRQSEYICDSEVVMTGGTAEAVFAGAERSIYGKITCYLLGGAVTRRAYAGCYNNYGIFSGWGSDYCVTGTSTLVFGPGLDKTTLTDKQPGNGIFGGSRRESNAADETGRLVFLDGCYDRFKSHIGTGDVCASHHDYLLAEGEHGSAVFADLTEDAPENADAALVSIIPDAGYNALVNNAAYGGEYYSLPDRNPVTVSFEAGAEAIINANGKDGESKVHVNYFAQKNAKLIVAVYNADGMLVTMALEDIEADAAAQERLIPIDCGINSSYSIQVMMWDGMGNIKPLCEPFPVSIQAS